MSVIDYDNGEVPDDELPPRLRDDWPPIETDEGKTDQANAERFIILHGEDVRFVGPWKKWIVWTGQCWEIDDTLRIQAKAKSVSKELFSSLNVQTSSPRDFAWAKRSANVGSIDAMTRLAADKVAIRPDLLDKNPWLFNVQNGTIDLRTGAIRSFERNDMITKLSPVVFNSDATCSRWLEFLGEIFDGDQALVKYVQQLVGHFLTGCVDEQILPVFYGTGANGKSTLLETLAALLGDDYSSKAPKELFVKSNEHKTMVADLFGRRLVYTEETSDTDQLAEGRVKDLTGGGLIKARRMREDYWQFSPTHKLVLSTNHKPKISGTDPGIWRRVKLIPFTVTIPDAKRDKSLGKKLLSELPGILNWAIAGCLDWQANGLIEPNCVRVATVQYQQASDEIGEFINDHCVRGQAMIVSVTKLYECYKETGGMKSQKDFVKLVEARGYEKLRMGVGALRGLTCFRGIGLLAPGAD